MHNQTLLTPEIIDKMLKIAVSATVNKDLFLKQDKIILTNSYTANQDMSNIVKKKIVEQLYSLR